MSLSLKAFKALLQVDGRLEPIDPVLSMHPLVGRALTWTSALALAVIVPIGILRISLDIDIVKLLPPGIPEVRGLAAYIEHFTEPDELFLTIEAPNAAAAEEAAESLAAHLELEPELVSQVKWRSAWDEDLEGLSEIIAYAILNRPEEQFEAFAGNLAPGASQERLEETIERISFALSPDEAVLGAYDAFDLFGAAFGSDGSSPLAGSSDFSSEEGSFRLIVVFSKDRYGRGEYRDLTAWTAEIRESIREWRATYPDGETVRIRLTGEPAIMTETSNGMERDLRQSFLLTLSLIAVIFWVWYRRLLALGALVTMLGLIFLITLGIAGLLIQDLTVMNVGFASILIGLSVDYGILVFQDSLRHPGDAPAVRRRCRRGIVCAGATTSVAFASLAFSSLPSIAELGSLVAIGIAVGAGLMLTLFSSVMAFISRKSPPGEPPRVALFHPAFARPLGIAVIALIGIATWELTRQGFPSFDLSEEATRPRVSEAYDALDDIYAKLMGDSKGGLLLINAPDASTWEERWTQAQEVLRETLPEAEYELSLEAAGFVPKTTFQAANLKGSVPDLLAAENRLRSELEEAGFTDEASLLLRSVFETWRRWSGAELPIVPQTDLAKRILSYHLKTGPGEEIWTRTPLITDPDTSLGSFLELPGVLVADWDRTMRALRDRVPAEMMRLLAVLAVLVLIMLALTFRRLSDILWVTLSVGLSLTLLLGAMRWLDWTWNAFNLAAILLTLGAGLDYSIHILLGLRRHGDVETVQRDTGQALFVCALSSVAGFGSLSWANNMGLASLGRVCALALFLNALVAIFLLPMLWRLVHRPSPPDHASSPPPGDSRS